jgi:3-dehydroquinate synthase II/3-amino-4-hydroxybenzoic acid synthase
MNDKKIWYDARQVQEDVEDRILTVNQNSHFQGILLSREQIGLVNYSDRLTVAVQIERTDELDLLECSNMVIVSKDLEVLNQARKLSFGTAYYIHVDDQESLNEACSKAEQNPYLIIDFKDSTNIPLELVLAKLQNQPVTVIKRVSSAEDGRISSDVMETGADGVLLTTDSVEEILEMGKLAEKSKFGQLGLVKAKVTKVQHLGAGERACIDTTSLLTKAEGMIIGSTSSGGLVVCSETHYLPYMNTRPFRVNAGAVHSYVWCPNDTTEYITDMGIGSQVLAVDNHGTTRVVNVGRMKIEVRPLLLIEAEHEGKKVSTIVQDDWHIRIFDGDRQPKSATEFKPGDSILAYLCEPGRHVGIKISETITEK